MLTETEKYQLSLYETETVVTETKNARIEKVRSTLDGKTYIKRTYREDKRELFRTLQTIDSLFLPSIKEIFFDEDTIIIEEYIGGTQLTELLIAKKLTARQTEQCAKGLLQALESLHAHNVIHRDVKPDNILIAADGTPKLIDFGVARIYREHETKDTSQFGTEGYAAPEQYGFGQSDFRTDIYALGVTLQKMNANGRLKKLADKCAQFDPNNRFKSIEDAQSFLYKKDLRKRVLIPGVFFFIIICGIALTYQKQTPPSPIAEITETAPDETQQEAPHVAVSPEVVPEAVLRPQTTQTAVAPTTLERVPASNTGTMSQKSMMIETTKGTMIVAPGPDLREVIGRQ